MLGISPSHAVGMSGCPECQYCRYLQCHGNSAGCRGGPWLCPVQHCGHTAPRASPVALLLPLDLHRPLTDYGLQAQLPFRQHTVDDCKVDNAGLYLATPQEYKKVLENYASNSKFYNQENNQFLKQDQCKNVSKQDIKSNSNYTLGNVNEEVNMCQDQRSKGCSRNVESQSVYLPTIPEGIGVDADLRGRPSSKPINIPGDMISQHKEHSRRKLDNQSPTHSNNTKHPKKLMDINTCTVSEINKWSNKVLSHQNSKSKHDKRAEENRGTPVNEPYIVQAHINVKEKYVSSPRTVSPVSKSFYRDSMNESELNDYLAAYKVNQDITIDDERIKEGFYSVKTPHLPRGMDNDQLCIEIQSPMARSLRPETFFQKDSGNCSDVSSSSVNLKSVPCSPSRPHCSMLDYSIDVGGHGAAASGLSGAAASSGDDPVEDAELGAFWELLEEDIRPIQPLKHSMLSHQIFQDHKEMAHNYLILQQELFNLQRQKLLMEEKLSHSEQLEQSTNHRYQDKIRQLMGKRDSLHNNHGHLKQQLEHIRSQEKRPLSFAEAKSQHIRVGATLYQPPP